MEDSSRVGKEDLAALADQESSLQVFWCYFKRHKIALISGIIIISLYLLVIFAGFLGPYGPTETFKQHFFHAPSKIHLFDDGGLTWPYVYETKKVGWGEFKEIKTE